MLFRSYRFFSTTSAFLEDNGYVHYEVSNFARAESLVSRHNHKYWDHTPYLGLGPAAHSFRGNRRWWNHRNLQRYIGDLHAGRTPVDGREDLSQEQLRMEARIVRPGPCMGPHSGSGGGRQVINTEGVHGASRYRCRP